MASSFADVEARVAASGMRLANADATVGAGPATVSGIFERQTLILNGVEGTHPTFTLLTSEVTASAIAYGTQLTISESVFTVRGLEPDGAGITALILEAD
jgi:hypothetical protein